MAGRLEIEAKFQVSDQETLSQILHQEQLDRFDLRLAPTYQVEDIYQDTAENHLHKAGYACRIRRKGGSWIATLKEQGETRDMIHERMELDVALPYLELDPLRWPDSEVRQLAIQLSGGVPLHRVFTIRQTRHTRIVTDQERQIAELSLDEVRLDIPGQSETYFELELECLPEGSLEDIRELSALLMAEWSLEPQTQSKFLRAMSKKDQDAEKVITSSSERKLLPGHRPILECIAEADHPLYVRRANLLLAWDDGAVIQTLRSTSDYSRSSVYHWLRAYRQEGITIFPKQILSLAEAAACPAQSETARHETGIRGEVSESEDRERLPLHLEDLYRRYDVDMDHARHVAHLALELFDASQEIHGLPESCRQLLEYGGMVHNIGLNVDPVRHHTAGRDIVLETPVAELSDEERLMVAAMIFLHRKRITPKKLKKKTVAAVPDERRREMLDLAALLRAADGLDYSQSQSTRIVEVNATPVVIEVVLEGPYALHDAARAEKKADLWNLLHPLRFFFASATQLPGRDESGNEGSKPRPDGTLSLNVSAAEQSEASQAASFQPPLELEMLEEWVGDAPGILAGDTMSEGGRKLFRFHLHRMLHHEPGTRRGEDIEELHDMRVATRRLRSAFRLVSDFFIPKDVAPFTKGLRRTARMLGAVRDLDVLIDKANKYQETLPPERRDGPDPLLASWRLQRETARQRMIAYLKEGNYRRFVKTFTEFVTAEGAGARPVDPSHPHPHLVCHVVPRLVYTHFEAVRAYENWLDDPPLERLHALRIDCKRLRYAMEFFREVLGAEAKMVIKEVTALQDHLGELHDADVADHLLRDFLDGGIGAPSSLLSSKKRTGSPRQRIMAPGVAIYLAEKQTELQTLVRTFPEVWSHFNRLEVRQNLAASVAVL